MKGLAKVALGRGNIEVTEREERAPVDGEVLLRVIGAGICGTDLHIEDDEFPSRPPVTLGHEIAGIVDAVGPGVNEEWLGARVVSESPYFTCGTCDLCRNGARHLCQERLSIGIHVDGAFAPQVVVPAVNLHRIPDWLDDHAAALTEPLACVCNCLCDPPAVVPGDDVLVVGPGPIGLLAAQVARAHGGTVTVAGLQQDRRRLLVAEQLDFPVIETDAPDAAGPAQPFDVTIECSGSAAGVASCVTQARRRGTFIQIGVCGKPVTIPFDLIFQKELTIRPRFSSTARSWRRALTLIEMRRVALEPLITEVVALNDWDRISTDLRRGQSLKVVLDPRLESS